MHLGSAVHSTVAFLGHADPTSPGGIKCEGTGFWVHYKGAGYLITARHVAETIQVPPFVIRLNRRGGGAELIDVEQAEWVFPDDKLVDLAALPYELPRKLGYDAAYITEGVLGRQEAIGELQIDVGDFCYTVGLFHYFYGDQRNYPLVHSGNIALMPPPGETIPVYDEKKRETERVEAYLIESRAIDGASGSPVFARASYRFEGLIGLPEEDEFGSRVPIFAEGRVWLLGLFSGAWFAPPDSPVAKNVRAQRGTIVPVGVGVVVPAKKIIELLESDVLKDQRAKKPPVGARKLSVTATDDPPANDENPNHREDFKRLEALAARKPEQAS
jgi:hypothetical protein